eukprot:1150709-Pelagomonas_calceolata.AAC.1
MLSSKRPLQPGTSTEGLLSPHSCTSAYTLACLQAHSSGSQRHVSKADSPAPLPIPLLACKPTAQAARDIKAKPTLFNSLPSDLQEGERAFKSNAPRACSTREEGLRVTKGVQPGLKGKLTLGQPGPRHANPTLPQGTKRSKARQLHSTKGHQEVQGAPAPLYQRAPRGPRHANSTLPKDTQVQGTLIPLYQRTPRSKAR